MPSQKLHNPTATKLHEELKSNSRSPAALSRLEDEGLHLSLALTRLLSRLMWSRNSCKRNYEGLQGQLNTYGAPDRCTAKNPPTSASHLFSCDCVFKVTFAFLCQGEVLAQKSYLCNGSHVFPSKCFEHLLSGLFVCLEGP